jgi:hypothetical protein
MKMKKIILLSFIFFVSTSIGFRVGYRSGVHSAPARPVHVTLDFFYDPKRIDNWTFLCNVIHIEIIERDETDEKFSNELNDVINKFVTVNNKKIDKSTFVKYCK